jgi:hypothetical protein
MKPTDLKLRCYAEQEENNTWFAICIDLNLAAQADTFEEVRAELHKMVRDYVMEALTVDAQHIEDLIPRHAPWPFLLRYYWLSLLERFHKATRETATRLFTEHLPLIPA